MTRYLVWDCEMAPATAYIWDLRVQGGYLNKDMLISRKKLLCVAAKFTGADEPMHFFSEWDDPEGMLHGMRELLDQADASVTFNGLQADVRWLNTEFVLAGMDAPAVVRQVDLYRVIRSKLGLMSNSLAYACREMGLDHKTDSGGMKTIVGAMNGDTECRERLAEYCKNDVRITEELLHRVASYVPVLPNAAMIGGIDKGCPSCGSTRLVKQGFSYSATGAYQRYKCTSCSRWSRSAQRAYTTELRSLAA